VHFAQAGAVQCPKCQWHFEIDDDGGVVSTKEDLDEDLDEDDFDDEDLDEDDFDDEDLDDFDDDKEYENDDDNGDELDDDNDGDVAAGEPVMATCPECEEKVHFRQPGEVNCPECGWKFEINDDGGVVDGEPIVATCPECQEELHFPQAGPVQCTKCHWHFEIDDDGDVVSTKEGLDEDLDEDEMNFDDEEEDEIEGDEKDIEDQVTKGSQKLTAPAFGPGVAAKIDSIRQEQNAVQNGETGLLIHVAFDVSGMKGETGHLAVYFFDARGAALADVDQLYRSSNGQVYAGVNFTPPYEATTWQDFRLFIPYSQLHLRDGHHNLKFCVEIYKLEAGAWRQLTRSRNESFQVRWNISAQ
jgi:hypothetical protein